jgi:hypothetical protein
MIKMLGSDVTYVSGRINVPVCGSASMALAFSTPALSVRTVTPAAPIRGTGVSFAGPRLGWDAEPTQDTDRDRTFSKAVGINGNPGLHVWSPPV